MATTPKTKIGHMACQSCGERIPVKQAANGTLNLSCPECDFTGYAKTGTDAHRKAMARITMIAAPAAPATQPAPKPAAKAAPAPAPTVAAAPVSKRNTVFG